MVACLVLYFLIEGLLAGAQAAASFHRSTSAPLDQIQCRHARHKPSVSFALSRTASTSEPKYFRDLRRLSVTDDHDLLLMRGLEFQPLARPLARIIVTRRAFGDHAFFMRPLCPGELPLAELDDMLAVAQ